MAAQPRGSHRSICECIWRLKAPICILCDNSISQIVPMAQASLLKMRQPCSPCVTFTLFILEKQLMSFFLNYHKGVPKLKMIRVSGFKHISGQRTRLKQPRVVKAWWLSNLWEKITQDNLPSWLIKVSTHVRHSLSFLLINMPLENEMWCSFNESKNL